MKNLKTFMKSLMLVLSISLISNIYAQEGINFSLGTGTSLIRAEVGYTFLKKVNVGAYYVPSFLESPRSFGVSGRYYGKTNEIGSASFFQFSTRGYLGASLGMISDDEDMELGYSGNLGVDFLYGKSGAYSTFFEANIGNSPNYFNSLMSSFSSEGSEKSLGSVFGFMFGFRFYI
jgi:hypothetical protein